MTQLETERLILRKITRDDAEALHQTIFSDPDVMRYLPGGVPKSRQETDTTLEKIIVHWVEFGFGLFALINKDSGALIGEAGLIHFIADGEERVEVAYALAKNHWYKGLAAEAARACLEYGFETLHLDEIVAVYVAENTNSARVMQKLGMTYQGIARTYDADLPMYLITRDEFEKQRR